MNPARLAVRTALLLLCGSALGSAALAGPVAAKATANSVHEDENGRHPAEAAFDGLMASGWGEGQDGAGKGSWIELDMRAATEIKSLSIWPGNLSEGKKSYREYSRPHTLSLWVDGKQVGNPVRVLDEMQRLDLPVGLTGRTLRITVDEVYEGFVYSDCYLAEVAVNYVESAGAAQADLDTWRASPAGQDASAAYLAQLGEEYQACKAAEFGAPLSLAWLMDAAGDGAPYLREQVVKHVPMGRRAQAITYDRDAIDALRKLKDANSIPALEMAKLRAVSKDRAWLDELVEIFYAYQDLIGGPNPNTPYWGETGWGEGAMQSFGEPTPIDVDRFGSVYVADVGNNRVQRFADNGRPDRVWGGEPGIANTWFARGRPWYVSGSEPGDGPGQFHNPIAITLIPEKEFDVIAILDARGRVQLFDPDGNQLIGWQLNTVKEVEPGLGGEGHMVWLPSKGLLYVFFGDEVIGFDRHGQEIVRFEIREGAPNDVLVYHGKFLLVYRDEIVRYEADGFRDRVMMDMDRFDAGFEDVDIALDETGAIWVVTDTGRAFKFKRPGKLEFQVDISEYSLEHPRFCVREGLIHATDRDKIIVIDALQALLDQQEAAAEEAAQRAAAEEATEEE